jgi:MoxR-like ATPase
MSDKSATMAGVCDLLDKLSTVDAAKIAKAKEADDAAKIKAVEPDPALLYPMEPDFVVGPGNLRHGDKMVDFREVFDAYVEGEILYLFGPTGAGKTTIARALVDAANAKRLDFNRKVHAKNVAAIKEGKKVDQLEGYKALEYRLSMVQGHEEMRAAEMIGDVDLVYDDHGNRHVSHRLGTGLEAAVEGHTLLVDESDAIPSGVMAGCHGLFDRRVTTMTFCLNGPKVFTKHPRFRAIFAANTRGMGENAAEYAHAQMQSKALLNRFSYMVEVGYMSAATERKLMQSRVPEVSVKLLDKMIAAANNVRTLYTGGSIDLVISHRDMESWCRETRRAIKRGVSGNSDSDLWTKAVQPAAWPAFLCKTADKGTAQAVAKELEWR